MPTTPPLPDLSRLRELGDELLGELSTLVPNLSDRTKAHVSLVDAVVRKLDCDGPLGSVFGLLGLGRSQDDAVVPATPSAPEADAAVIPITKKAPAKPAAKAPAKKAPAKKAPVKRTPAKKTPAERASAGKASAATRAPAKKTPAKKTPAKRASAGKAPAASGELAIPGYDALAASQVIPRMDSLSPGELEALRLHELGGRGRRTILTRIAQIQGR